MAGTRIEPSLGGVKKLPRQGPLDPPSTAWISPAALSLENTISVLLAMPASSTQSTIWPTR
jgi:hypothetical protein